MSLYRGDSLALDPTYPIVATCQGSGFGGQDSVYGVRYVIKINDEYTLVGTVKAMQELFAPIDNPSQALSYAQLVTLLDAKYSFDTWGDQVFLQQVIEDSHVTETNDGYIVHLYHVPKFGCGPDIVSRVDVIVRRDGTIIWGDVVPAYFDVHRICRD